MQSQLGREALTVVVGTALLGGFPVSAVACEPLPPLLLLFMAPSLLTGSLTGVLGFVAALTAGIGLKCGAFAYFEPSLPRGQALWAMFLANLVTTVVGGFVALALSLPPLLFLFPLFYALMVSPMRRLAHRAARRWLGPYMLSLVFLLLFLASYVLFFLAQAQLASGGSLLGYWGLKLAYLYPALIVSLLLTTLWEEWIVSGWARDLGGHPAFYGSVLRANLIMLLVLLGVTAAVAVPKRLAAPDFLLRW